MLSHLTGIDFHVQSATSLSHLTSRFEDYLLELDIEGRSPDTIKYYRYQTGKFVSFCLSRGKTAPQDINTQDILYFLSELKKTNSPYSLHDYYRAMRAFLNWLVREKEINESPLANIKPPKVPKKFPVPFSQEDISKILTLCSGDKFLDKRNLAIVLVYMDTGIRLREMSSLTFDDMDIKTGVIKIMGKGAKERFVKMGKTTRRAVWEYLKMREDHLDCLWVTEERHPLTKDGISSTIESLCKRAGVTKAKKGSHSFRHFFATNAIRNGANLFYVQSLLGHSKLEMTRVYAMTLDSEKAIEEHEKFSPVDRMKKK